MKIRKGNSNEPIKNNQKSDKVIIDGLMTAEDLVNMGTKAGINTIEQLRQLYPHNPILEKAENEIMNDEELVKKLRIAGKDNDEKINAMYMNQKLKESIRLTRNKINELNEKYAKTHQQNLIYEKDRLIKELQNELDGYKNKIKVKE